MSNTRKGKKQCEEEFEPYVRNCLATLCYDVHQIKHGQDKLHEEITNLKGKVHKNDKAIS